MIFYTPPAVRKLLCVALVSQIFKPHAQETDSEQAFHDDIPLGENRTLAQGILG